ncbi:hypothetical protein [Sutcliffiella rhizosphaerae]|uniref:Lipoprotein n=1 Tax=Sutcliffiella rhizosphaerae TaxID=2880967 RepID=A0ABM8YIT8_9BACI|nr:hypothetical protein [Sutcliffiella rhizosphaerae]CAG9619836.1 hypothetical protein BACCIP111883_00604 [Sutcliffiella rhizosphaerae]
MRVIWTSFICILFILTGCKEEQQKPKSMVETDVNVMEVLSHSSSSNQKMNMRVHHSIKGNDVYLECIVTPNFHFVEGKQEKKHGEGMVVVFLDNKQIGSFTKGAFVINDIPKGKHELTITLLHNDKSEYGISEKLEIDIE